MMETAQGGEVEDAEEDDTTTQTCDESLVVRIEDKFLNQDPMVPIEGITVTATSQNDDTVTTITESVVSHIDEIDNDYFFTFKGILKEARAAKHTYIHIHTYIHTYIHMHTYTYIHTYIHTHP